MTLIVDDVCHLPPLVDNVVVAHILPCLPMTLSMLWCLCQVNKGWCTVVGETIAWSVLGLVNINNQAYQKIVAMHGLKKHSLHE